MGRLLLVWRLVRGDIKRRRLRSALLVAMIATTTTTLTLALALYGVSNVRFAHAREATRGADVVAMYGTWRFSHPAMGSLDDLSQFEALRHAPGVVGAAGPYPLVFPQLVARGVRVRVVAEGRSSGPTAIDQPLLTSGRWVRRGGVVIERAFAVALGARVGQSIRLDGAPMRIVGIAVTTSQPSYPGGRPQVWLTRAGAERLETSGHPAGYALNLKLADPSNAPVFAAEHAAPLALRKLHQAWTLMSRQNIRALDLKTITVERRVLLSASWLLALFAAATIVVLVGTQMAEQTRRLGLLKAVGGTPRLIAVVLIAENLLLALVAAFLGLVVGRLLVPTLAHASDGLLGSGSSSFLTGASVALIVLVAAGVATGAAIVPAIRGARTSTIAALSNRPRRPSRWSQPIAHSIRLPVVLLLATRLVVRRGHHFLLASGSGMIAVATIVATLTMQHEIEADNSHLAAGQLSGASMLDRTSQLVFLLTAIVIVLAAISTTVTTWATVLAAQRAAALARALGATSFQVTAGLATAQLIPAFVAACLGIPLGLELYALVGYDGNASPPILWLVAVIPGTLLVVMALASIPARIGMKRSVITALRSE